MEQGTCTYWENGEGEFDLNLVLQVILHKSTYCRVSCPFVLVQKKKKGTLITATDLAKIEVTRANTLLLPETHLAKKRIEVFLAKSVAVILFGYFARSNIGTSLRINCSHYGVQVSGRRLDI
jgi:hypothetical protein